MRVLGLIGTLPDATAPAGPPRALALLRLLADAGHEVQLVVGEPLGGDRRILADAAAAAIGGPVTAAAGTERVGPGTEALRWALPVRLAAEYVTPLARTARALAPSVDLVFSFDDPAHGAASAVSGDVPTLMDLVHIRGVTDDGDWARTSRARWTIQPHRSWERRVLGRGFGVIAPSTQTRARMDRLYYRRPVIVPTPVARPAVAGADTPTDDTFTVGWYGDTRDPGDREGLARLAAELWPLVGDGAARLLLADAARPAELAAAGALPGAEAIHPDGGIAELTARCTIAIRPLWRAGGDGAATLTLMAAGLPVVGTPQAFEGIDVHPGMEGLIADTPSRLAIALRKLAEDPASTRQIAGQGQQHVLRHHAPEAVTPILEGAIEKAITRFGDYRAGRVPTPIDPAGAKRQIEETLKHARAAGAHLR
ncbi:glycosyltransferase [Svornostia abyssi]|uniref:Glycosyltransferase n=1 Tax=Svornostia abyssi TaxID=2898438 RepID=A0ABY5PKX0_9ACTN|nr:glycosyltransferase [Parviterribacteraceae bacterium J379]